MNEAHCRRNPRHRRTRAREQGTRALDACAVGAATLLVASSVCSGSVRARCPAAVVAQSGLGTGRGSCQ